MRRPLARVAVVLALAAVTIAGTGIAAWRWSAARESQEARQNATPSTSAPIKIVVGEAAPLKQPAWTAAADNAVQLVSGSETVRTTKQPARIEPYEHTAIYAKASGFVSKVNVDLGSRVQRGAILAELWIPEMQQDRAQKQALIEEAQAAVGQAEAAITASEALVAAAAAKVREANSVVARSSAEVTFRQSEHTRFTDLVSSKAIERKLEEEKLNQLQAARSTLAAAEAGVASAEANERVEQARLKQARANHVLAQSRLKVAQAELKQVEILLDYAVIRAPYDGIVTERHVHTGDFAQSAASGKSVPLFSMMRADPLRIVVDVPEADAGWMRTGLPATLSVDGMGDQPFRCVVQRMAEMLDPSTRTLRIELEVTDRSDGLRPGMYGAATITNEHGARSAGVGNPASFGSAATD
jgi:multidrug resistance efflux pump